MATTISAGTLRLLLTSISYRAKARKEIRREPPVVPRRQPCPCRWTAPPGVSLASDPHTAGADPAGLAWSAVCCTVWHGSITGAHRCTLIYLIIIGWLCWPVQRPGGALVSWYALEVLRCCDTLHRVAGCVIFAYSGLVSADGCIMGQTTGKAPVKPCALFCGVGGITCTDGIKAFVNACMWLYCRRTKKPCTLRRCKAKEKPGHF